jgi:hypothetical protein
METSYPSAEETKVYFADDKGITDGGVLKKLK